MTDSRTLGQSVPKEGLFLTDGIEGLRSLPNHSVDMLLTDPPYGTTRNYWDVPLPLPELWEDVYKRQVYYFADFSVIDSNRRFFNMRIIKIGRAHV